VVLWIYLWFDNHPDILPSYHIDLQWLPTSSSFSYSMALWFKRQAWRNILLDAKPVVWPEFRFGLGCYGLFSKDDPEYDHLFLWNSSWLKLLKLSDELNSCEPHYIPDWHINGEPNLMTNLHPNRILQHRKNLNAYMVPFLAIGVLNKTSYLFHTMDIDLIMYWFHIPNSDFIKIQSSL